uniref:Uncharacterized protein n=1 Tax=Glossina palpalis gambiensis TaxID=67801 RepID=A0A1B0BNR4_9MUSC
MDNLRTLGYVGICRVAVFGLATSDNWKHVNRSCKKASSPASNITHWELRKIPERSVIQMTFINLKVTSINPHQNIPASIRAWGYPSCLRIINHGRSKKVYNTRQLSESEGTHNKDFFEAPAVAQLEPKAKSKLLMIK